RHCLQLSPQIFVFSFRCHRAVQAEYWSFAQLPAYFFPTIPTTHASHFFSFICPAAARSTMAVSSTSPHFHPSRDISRHTTMAASATRSHSPPSVNASDGSLPVFRQPNRTPLLERLLFSIT